MPEETCYCMVGDITLQIVWRDGRRARPLPPIYEPFCCSALTQTQRAPDLQLGVATARQAPPTGTVICDNFPHWRLWTTADGYLYEVFDARPPHPRIHWAAVDAQYTIAHVWVERGRADVSRLMEPLGQLLLIHRWQQCCRYMLHALAVDDRGVGRIFVGASGTGKSTLAGWYQADGCAVLSDERVIVGWAGDQLVVYGTPWPGMAWTGQPGPITVHTVHLLHQAPQHAEERLPPREAVALLYPQLFLADGNQRNVQQALQWCEQLVQRVPAHRLRFAKDPSVLDFLRRHDRIQEPVLCTTL